MEIVQKAQELTKWCLEEDQQRVWQGEQRVWDIEEQDQQRAWEITAEVEQRTREAEQRASDIKEEDWQRVWEITAEAEKRGHEIEAIKLQRDREAQETEQKRAIEDLDNAV